MDESRMYIRKVNPSQAPQHRYAFSQRAEWLLTDYCNQSCDQCPQWVLASDRASDLSCGEDLEGDRARQLDNISSVPRYRVDKKQHTIIAQQILVESSTLALLSDICDPYATYSKPELLRPSEQFIPQGLVEFLVRKSEADQRAA